MRTLLGWLAAALLCVAPAFAEPQQVIVVRHAEKAHDGRSDPPLAAAGHARAQALATALADAGVDAIVVTQFRRTQLTAAPLAERLGVQPQIVEAARGGLDAHVAAVVDAVRQQDGVVLVVGHSNTVLPILAALGAPVAGELGDDAYSDLFVWRAGGGVVRARYGEDD